MCLSFLSNNHGYWLYYSATSSPEVTSVLKLPLQFGTLVLLSQNSPLYGNSEVTLHKIGFLVLLTSSSSSSRDIDTPAQSSVSSLPQPRSSNRVQALIPLPNTNLPHPFFNFKSTSCILSCFHLRETFVARSQHSVSSF